MSEGIFLHGSAHKYAVKEKGSLRHMQTTKSKISMPSAQSATLPTVEYTDRREVLEQTMCMLIWPSLFASGIRPFS